jgi:hypothetical protein
MQKTILISLLISLFISAELISQESTVNKQEFLPDIDGIIKTKAELDLNNSQIRFEARNVRFGAKGKINQYISYKTEIDLSDEGKIKMLDAYVRFTPLTNLDFYMGQRKIPFSTDYIRNPAENIFTNLSFLSKYINEGMRDIGFFANYKFTGNIPVDLVVGAVNRTGNNNPLWTDKPNLVGRLAAGSEKGIRLTGNIYYEEAINNANLAMYGGEIRYTTGPLFIESEYIIKNWTDSLLVRSHEDHTDKIILEFIARF